MIDRRSLLAGSTAMFGLAAVGQGHAEPSPGSDPATVATLNALFDAIYKENLATSPETLTSLGIDKGEYAAAKSKLDDYSVAETLRSVARNEKNLALLKAIPRDKLMGMDRINYDTILWRMQLRKSGTDRFKFGGWGSSPYILSQLTGAYQDIPDFLSEQHTIETKADAEAYLSRLDAFAEVIKVETSRFLDDVKMGITPPDFIIDRTVGQMNALRDTKGVDSPMTKALVTKTAAKNIPGDWGTEAAKRIDGPIHAAIVAQINALQTVRAKATHDAGVWHFNKPDFYAFAAQVGTTTTMTSDEIHQLGLDLVKEISAEADTKLKALGFTTGTVGQRMAALGDDPKYVYPNTDEAKEELLGHLNDQIKVVSARLPQYFGVLPKTPVTVKRVPKATEAGAPGGYYQRPTLDGSRPGAYYINLRDTKEWPKWSLPTLTYHEAIPGHHLQISIQMEAKGLPMLRKVGGFSAFSEGWALYAELLAGEMGMYDNDPVGYIGYLQSSLFRAIRLVVDTGLHHKKWTREQAIKYFVDTNGDAESAATTEVERYCVWPGQALSYMTGKIQWMRLRNMAKAKLGDKFDIKAFHDAGLVSGPVPLAVLEQVYRDKGFI